MNAPATAPIGPSTTAPVTAPSAASPARFCADAAEDASNRIVVALASVLIIFSDPSEYAGNAGPSLWPDHEASGSITIRSAERSSAQAIIGVTSALWSGSPAVRARFL